MNDSWAWTTVWGLPEGVGRVWMEGAKGEKFEQL